MSSHGPEQTASSYLPSAVPQPLMSRNDQAGDSQTPHEAVSKPPPSDLSAFKPTPHGAEESSSPAQAHTFQSSRPRESLSKAGTGDTTVDSSGCLAPPPSFASPDTPLRDVSPKSSPWDKLIATPTTDTDGTITSHEDSFYASLRAAQQVQRQRKKVKAQRAGITSPMGPLDSASNGSFQADIIEFGFSPGCKSIGGGGTSSSTPLTLSTPYAAATATPSAGLPREAWPQQ